MSGAHIKPDDIVAPVDIRLVPAAAVTALVCLLGPDLPLEWVHRLGWLLPLAGLLLLIVAVLGRRSGHQRLGHWLLVLCLACWFATPAALVVQQHRVAAETSGWFNFTSQPGEMARMSVRLITDPVQREGPFGPSWFVTAQVEHYGRALTATPHPAKIVVSADATWAQLGAEDRACFMGRVSEAESTVFVQALTAAQPGDCHGGTHQNTTTGRDMIRTALRAQAAQTVGYAPELLPGLILGDRSQQSETIDLAMKISGLSHLSAVSGAHTSLIAAAATIIFRTLRLPRGVVVIAFLATLVLFVQIVGLQPSIIRAATMGAIGAWAVFFGRSSQALPILALSTIIILTVSPQLISEAGFQLSVVATAGIVLGAQPLERWIRPGFEKILPDFWATLLSSSFAISAAAQVACQPVLLTFIEYISVYSLLANIFATPLLPLITIPGTLAAAVCVITPGLSQLVLHIVALPATAIGWIATTATNLPGATLSWPTGPIGTGLIVLHWAATAVVLYRLLRRQRQVRPAVRIETAQSRFDRLMHSAFGGLGWKTTVQLLIVTVAVCAHVTVLWPTNNSSVPANWDLVGCDVGQGDMFLVRTGPESALVIDTGDDEIAAQQCLHTAGVRHLDMVIITHLHADHVGAIAGVLAAATVDDIVYSTSADPTYHPEDTELPSEAQRIDRPVVGIIDHAHNDDDHSVAIRWTIISANSQSLSENNASIVMLVEIFRHGGTTTALFTGDLEEDATARLLADNQIPGPVDILKLPHHGATNGGTDLIEHTKPTVAFIGVGQDNTYGHPSEDILTALGPQVEVKRTDQDGTFAVTLQHSPVQWVAGG